MKFGTPRFFREVVIGKGMIRKLRKRVWIRGWGQLLLDYYIQGREGGGEKCHSKTAKNCFEPKEKVCSSSFF